VRPSRLWQEDELLPFAPGFPPGRRWLFLAPHPDDESFGPGACLARARAAGVEIHTVIVTDGRVQGDPVVRADELRRAAALLGLAPPELWGFADRTLDPADRALRDRLAQTIARWEPDLVLTPAPVDLNIDHRALALALQRTLRRLTVWGLVRRGPQWVAAYEVGCPILPNLLVGGDEWWDVKLQAAACYSSQHSLHPYLEVVAALGTLRRLTLAGCNQAEALHVLPAGRVAGMTARAWAAAMGSPRMVAVHPAGPPGPAVSSPPDATR
jgi:N-acetylglucosamine malate deacetylase 1